MNSYTREKGRQEEKGLEEVKGGFIYSDAVDKCSVYTDIVKRL